MKIQKYPVKSLFEQQYHVRQVASDFGVILMGCAWWFVFGGDVLHGVITSLL